MPLTTAVMSHPSNSSTPPSMSSARRNTDLHDRMNQLDSRVLELQSTVLTEEGYVNRRNREDEYIRDEFKTHRAMSDRIDLNVGVLRSDVGLLRSGVDQIRTESRQLRTELVTLDQKMSHQFHQLKSAMKHSDRVRFNSLAHTISAPISSVPVITDDGALEWPKYFPRTVWKFWCLKKKSRVHHLVELAEFYQLGGYEDWSRMQQTNTFADSDSSDSSDGSFVITREEAVRRFPENAHQALAATLGLVYYKIRNEVGEGSNAVPFRTLKRQQGNVDSASPDSKPVKMPRRPSVSDTFLQRLINGPSVAESQSSVSEELDKLGWKPFSDVSEDGMSKLRSIDPQDIEAVLRGLEQGRLKLKPSASEARRSPAGSKESNASRKRPAKSVENSEVSTVPNTPSQPLPSPSSKAKRASVPGIPETSSHSDSAIL
ncbi:hypothetical protein N7526_011454 [Penicillium atrosanguineum]|nr:hypothetical protein N7526_011454 [Penicillium atrosanguineum]